jgi:hypothetical protein
MCGPLRGAIMGIAVFEGWAKDLGDAASKAAAGAFAFHPNHHFGAVGPMTGMTTKTQPVLVVENHALSQPWPWASSSPTRRALTNCYSRATFN